MRKWSPNPLHRYRVTYPFGFVARNPTLSLVSRFQATQKRLASIVAERGKADHARFYTPGFTRRPVRTEMGPHQVEHEEEIAELWEQL